MPAEKPLIAGVHLKRLTPHVDERGFLMEMLRSDDPLFQKFGQAYVSLNYPGVIRAWHWHEKQTDYWVVVKGM
ncbi:MAG: dTDP-4-dehydrorhamnose 3,5-epimerase family protein, partial [Fimbriimonadales bacterium]|nr:dTDP-4-dehydrorhamnose 3,5-epimerase family protein [Fimbriimonadales bacterium]